MSVQISPVNLRNITGEESGPGVDGDGGGGTTTDEDGTGLGLLAGAIGGVGAVLARFLSDHDSSTDSGCHERPVQGGPRTEQTDTCAFGECNE